MSYLQTIFKYVIGILVVFILLVLIAFKGELDVALFLLGPALFFLGPQALWLCVYYVIAYKVFHISRYSTAFGILSFCIIALPIAFLIVYFQLR